MNETIGKKEIAVLLAITAVVGSVFTSYIPGAVYLDLPLVFTLYIGWHSSPAKGAASGAIFGWLQDAVFGMFLGLNGSSKTILGFLGAYLSKWLVLEQLFARFVMLGLLSLLDNVMVAGIAIILGQPLPHGFWLRTLIEIPVTGVAGGIIFQVYDRMKFPQKDFRRLEGDSSPL